MENLNFSSSLNTVRLSVCAGDMVDRSQPVANQLDQAVTIIKKQVKTILDTKAESSASKKQVRRAFPIPYVQYYIK